VASLIAHSSGAVDAKSSGLHESVPTVHHISLLDCVCSLITSSTSLLGPVWDSSRESNGLCITRMEEIHDKKRCILNLVNY
jgi:hypothetical protein